ncbi:uncharacterized protein PHACADRAFT_261550 [Phanerochaete carnosa HHB-10118-sp]|uniref:Uncharacterized protein n=1 Tax=Phanerochaete carnosa (strain HHB-10118-sp) TaxID=650164 RepID=K5WR97_PHACS|nr:uncharacterized protein PHACADRAFT_261550 [Phanerochaete carnosa HHB-10118-sp]EKM52882.1 hypothetical protein PHACADRAFT_261550 [Phanerochaete carnosa HHB-10118-sp]
MAVRWQSRPTPAFSRQCSVPETSCPSTGTMYPNMEGSGHVNGNGITNAILTGAGFSLW